MKKQASPLATAGIIACALLALGFVIWRISTSRPDYPGMNAQQPTKRAIDAPEGKTTPEQAFQKGIPGVNPNASAAAR